MKYLMTILMCLLITGCVTHTHRFDPDAKAKRSNDNTTTKHGPNHEKKIGAGDELGKRIEIATKRINLAIDQGKITPEEGKEMIEALKKKVRQGRNTCTKG